MCAGVVIIFLFRSGRVAALGAVLAPVCAVGRTPDVAYFTGLGAGGDRGWPKLIRILVRGGVRAYRRVRFSNENSRRAFRFFVGRDTRALRYTNDDVERSANRSKFTEYLTFGYGSNEITVFKSNRYAHLPGTRKPSALRTSVRFIYTATRKSILLVVRLGSRQ